VSQALEGAAYDAYMTGVIFCCMAFGIDFPHLDKEVCKQRTEKALKVTFKEDYLNTFELGAYSATCLLSLLVLLLLSLLLLSLLLLLLFRLVLV
jgi:hypothetical protein